MENNFETFVKKYWEQERIKEREILFPIGSRFITDDAETNPADILGIGTWERFEGKVAVGINDSEDSAFNEKGTIIGEEKHTMTMGELCRHSHTPSSETNVQRVSVGNDMVAPVFGYSNPNGGYRTSEAGNSEPFNVIQPTEVVGYMWIRRK